MGQEDPSEVVDFCERLATEGDSLNEAYGRWVYKGKDLATWCACYAAGDLSACLNEY